jgi:hypothetical protein
VTIILLKLTISPVVIVLASLLAHRFGPTIGGWLIGLPVTAGPVALFLALQHGAGFAAHVSTGFVAGVSAQAAFVLGYVALAARGATRGRALTAGTVAFTCTGLGVEALGLSLPELVACALAMLILGLRLVPAAPAGTELVPTRNTLFLRMAAATVLVLAITSFASTLGPELSGVATTFPLLSTILAFSLHRTDAVAAIAVYRGLLMGLFALAGFAASLTVVLSRLPLAAAFTIALALTLSIQLGSLQTLRRSPEVNA